MTYTIFIIPILTLVVGYLMFKLPPKKINYILGYRTKKSMLNQKNWNIANINCGKLYIKTGIILLIISLIIFILELLEIIFLTENQITIFILSNTLALIIPIFILENKLK